MSRPRRALAGLAGGEAATPLLVLWLLFLMDEFDTAATGVLAPDIKEHFGLSDSGIVLLAVAGLTVVLAFAVPIGHLGDRLPRRSIALTGAVLAGACSLATGLAPVVGVFMGARIGNGVGKLMNESVHPSLLADYYPPAARPRVLAAHRSANFVGAVAGSAVAGLLASAFSWRAAFAVLLVPMAATVAFGAARMREPLRGGTDDPDAARDAARDRPAGLGEAGRALLAVPTLRRQYASQLFVGAAVIPLGLLVPLLLDEEFGVGELGRGLIGALFALANMAGVLTGGRLSADDLGPAVRIAGGALSASGVLVALVALMPTPEAMVPVGMTSSFALGLSFPAPAAATARVAPARVRTLAFSFGAVFLVAGVWFLYFLSGVAAVADDHGPRVGLAAIAPFLVVGGLLSRSAAPFVAADTRAALESLALAARLRARPDEDRPLLACRGVEAGYGGAQVLFGIDLEVRAGECVALLGTNGAGKSTLLRAVSGTLGPSAGLIQFDGQDITHADGSATARAGIVQVPGGRATFPTLTVAEHLRLATWLFRDDPARAQDVTAEVYATFPALAPRRDQLAGNLSGGEQQMLALGMAFMAAPRLVMIDELSLGLAPAVVEQLLGIVRRMQAAGAAVLVVEQSLNVALSVADRAYFLEKGEVRFHGPTADLLDRHDLARSVFVPALPVAPTAPVAPAPAPPGATVALEVSGLTCDFGGIRAVDGLSLRVPAGQAVGLIGANGAGKTTALDLVSGFLRPTAGTIHLDGRDVTRLGPDRRARLGLGRSFQDARLVGGLTVAECLALAHDRHHPVRDHLAALLRLPAMLDAEEEVARSVADLVDLFGLGPYHDAFVRELSTGTRRLVDLAMSLAHRPTVLLLDEPSSGIAQREAEALAPLLRRAQRETGCALLVVEHDMALITAVSDRIVALEAGRVIAQGPPAAVLADPRVVASYLGTDPHAIDRSGPLEAHR